MPTPASCGFQSLIEILAQHEVEFIVVGGVAATLHGAPISTFDLDVVYRRSSENVARLTGVLDDLDAVYRDPGGRRIRPDASKLKTLRIHLLRTRLRPLDLLYSIGDGATFEDLVGKSVLMKVGAVTFRVLDLPAIILSKQQADRPKDRAALPILEETLRLRTESESANRQTQPTGSES